MIQNAFDVFKSSPMLEALDSGRTRFALTLVKLLLFAGLCFSQPAPAAVTFIAGDESAPPSSPVIVPFTVASFTDVLLFQFTIQWDPNVVQFSSIANLANLPGFTVGNFGTGSTGIGRLTVSWDDADLSGEDLINGAKLFDVNFTTIGLAGTSTLIQFTDDPTPRLVGVNVGGNPTPATFAQDDGSITVVPEPANAALALFGAIVTGTWFARWISGRRAVQNLS